MGGSDLMSMYATDDFVAWFARAFGADVPEAFQRFLNKNPRGSIGECGRLYPPGEIVAGTEARNLMAKAVCIIGRTNSHDALLLRVTDGKVFVVDESELTSVHATFASMDICLRLLALDQ